MIRSRLIYGSERQRREWSRSFRIFDSFRKTDCATNEFNKNFIYLINQLRKFLSGDLKDLYFAVLNTETTATFIVFNY